MAADYIHSNKVLVGRAKAVCCVTCNMYLLLFLSMHDLRQDFAISRKHSNVYILVFIVWLLPIFSIASVKAKFL